MTEVKIRRVQASDRARWDELFRGYIAFYKASVADEIIDELFRRLLSDEPGTHTGFVAVDANGRPVGLAHVLLHNSTWSNSGYLYLEDLYVDPACRQTGIGAALIRKTYEEADRLGASRTYWMTQEFNYRARALYDTLGHKTEFVQYYRGED